MRHGAFICTINLTQPLFVPHKLLVSLIITLITKYFLVDFPLIMLNMLLISLFAIFKLLDLLSLSFTISFLCLPWCSFPNAYSESSRKVLCASIVCKVHIVPG
jgi:hypothetical protein